MVGLGFRVVGFRVSGLGVSGLGSFCRGSYYTVLLLILLWNSKHMRGGGFDMDILR